MSRPAIIVEGLSKQYHIGARQNGRKTFREALTEAAAAPFRRLRAFGRSSDREEDTIWALKDVSFEVQPGEVVGVIGRNGAGKSTLLKILTRITEPTEGRAVLNGRVSSLLEVGTGFHSELTGRENIYLSGAILGMKKREIDAKFDEIVDFSGVEKFIDTPVKRYSSGMTVRLGFAVAAHLEPEILLVDEVLAVGDAEFQKKCLGKMGEVATSGRTVLFVSHNMGAVRQLTGTSILLCDGHLLRVGPTSEVVDLYLATLCHENATVYDVEGSPRRFQGLSRDVEFISLELDSGPSKTFCSGAEIPFLARVRGNRNVERFRISLTIFRSDGIPVGSLFTPESLSLHDREVAVFRVELRDLRLAPGRYHIGLAVGRGTPETGIRDFDIVVDVLHYEVLPPFGSRGTRSSWLAGWGAIMFGHCSVTRLG